MNYHIYYIIYYIKSDEIFSQKYEFRIVRSEGDQLYEIFNDNVSQKSCLPFIYSVLLTFAHCFKSTFNKYVSCLFLRQKVTAVS